MSCSIDFCWGDESKKTKHNKTIREQDKRAGNKGTENRRRPAAIYIRIRGCPFARGAGRQGAGRERKRESAKAQEGAAIAIAPSLPCSLFPGISIERKGCDNAVQRPMRGCSPFSCRRCRAAPRHARTATQRPSPHAPCLSPARPSPGGRAATSLHFCAAARPLPPNSGLARACYPFGIVRPCVLLPCAVAAGRSGAEGPTEGATRPRCRPVPPPAPPTAMCTVTPHNAQRPLRRCAGAPTHRPTHRPCRPNNNNDHGDCFPVAGKPFRGIRPRRPFLPRQRCLHLVRRDTGVPGAGNSCTFPAGHGAGAAAEGRRTATGQGAAARDAGARG